jgi:hypothetical protein
MFRRKSKLIEALSDMSPEDIEGVITRAALTRVVKNSGDPYGDTSRERHPSLQKIFANMWYDKPLWLKDGIQYHGLFVCGPYSRVPDRVVLTPKFDENCKRFASIRGEYRWQFFADQERIIGQLIHLCYHSSSACPNVSAYRINDKHYGENYYATQGYSYSNEGKIVKEKISGLGNIARFNPALYKQILECTIGRRTEVKSAVLICGDQSTLDLICESKSKE